MEPETTSEQKRRSIKPLATLFPYMMKYKFHVVSAMGFLLLAAATTLTLPVAVRRVVDHGFTNNDSGFVDQYFAVIVVIAAVLAIASAGRYYFVIWLGERVVSDIRKDVFAHLTTLGMDYFDTAKTGEIISRLTADTTQIKSAVGATASLALRNTLLGIGAIIMMTYTAPHLALIVIGAIPVIVLPIVAYGRMVRKRSRYAQDTLADATAYATESITAVSTLQAFSNGPMASNRFADAVERAFDAAKHSIRTRAFLTFFAILMIFTSVVAVLWFGAKNVLAGEMSPGVLGQFLLYSVLAAGALGALSEVWGELSLAAGAAERLTEMLHETPSILPPYNPISMPDHIRGEISFENVTFRYPSRPAHEAIKSLSVNIKAGETVAVVGHSGAGKSTLIALMLRFYDPSSGSIKLDGRDLRDYDPNELRKQFALVPQESVVFGTTARENIRFANPQSDDEAMITASKAAHADEFITKLSHGYDTRLGERGVTLSGGQRQRIAVARAILKNAPVFLLDEATSALDAESERLVQEAFDTLMHGKTTIIIAHRLATILKADRILVMEDGTIVEQGTHEELVKKNGVYANLARLQFDVENKRQSAIAAGK